MASPVMMLFESVAQYSKVVKRFYLAYLVAKSIRFASNFILSTLSRLINQKDYYKVQSSIHVLTYITPCYLLKILMQILSKRKIIKLLAKEFCRMIALIFLFRFLFLFLITSLINLSTPRLRTFVVLQRGRQWREWFRNLSCVKRTLIPMLI
jgi:hypothetical protein